MKLSKRWLYGSMGFLSLLGLIGIFTEERGFLAFFAFAVDFEFFFLPSDEMVDSYMTRSAARGFFCGMLSVAVVALAAFFWTGRDGGEALAAAFSAGWAVSVVVYALSAAYNAGPLSLMAVYYSFREKWGLEP